MCACTASTEWKGFSFTRSMFATYTFSCRYLISPGTSTQYSIHGTKNPWARAMCARFDARSALSCDEKRSLPSPNGAAWRILYRMYASASIDAVASWCATFDRGFAASAATFIARRSSRACFRPPPTFAAAAASFSCSRAARCR